MENADSQNRYVTFIGISCDYNAQRLLDRLGDHLMLADSSNPWVQYFRGKLATRQALGQDELFFVGSQISQLREFFQQAQDSAALELLEQIEEECC